MRITADNCEKYLKLGDRVVINGEGPFEVTYLYGSGDAGFKIDGKVKTPLFSNYKSSTISSSDVEDDRLVIKKLI